MLSIHLGVAQAALEHTLTEDEVRRNSRRTDQVYILSSHALAPDVYELADGAVGLDEAARTQLSKPLDASITGGSRGFEGFFFLWLAGWVGGSLSSVLSMHVFRV